MMGTTGQLLVFNLNDDHDGSNWLSQLEFVEKELTTLLVLQLMYEYVYVLNLKYYACQLVFLSIF